MTEWFNNSNVWFGGVVGAAIAIPAGIALAPPVIAGLGVIGGAAALTALGAGVIAITSVIGKHIDEAIEAHNSHETIKKILDSTEAGYTDDKKIEDIKRIAKAKTDNKFLKLFDHQSSQAIGNLYLGALDRKLPNISEEEYEDEKIIAGLKVVNKLDQLKSTNDEEFIRKLNEFKEKINLKSTYQVGQKITEQSEKFSYGVADVKSFFDTLAEGLVGGAAAAAAAPLPIPPLLLPLGQLK